MYVNLNESPFCRIQCLNYAYLIVLSNMNIQVHRHKQHKTLPGCLSAEDIPCKEIRPFRLNPGSHSALRQRNVGQARTL